MTLEDSKGEESNKRYAKVIVDSENERILGVGLVGPGAGELIAEAVLAHEMSTTAEDLRSTIYPHPTRSETLFDAAQMLFDG